jgi:hypothetical protein
MRNFPHLAHFHPFLEPRAVKSTPISREERDQIATLMRLRHNVLEMIVHCNKPLRTCGNHHMSSTKRRYGPDAGSAATETLGGSVIQVLPSLTRGLRP